MPAPYRLRLTNRADKDVERLRPWGPRVLARLLTLEQDPRAGHALSGDLAGARSLEFSLPGGAYRAAYVIDEALHECVVFLVGPHEGFYERAARRYAGLRAP